jgi:sigma-B regulation protein RsbQ
MQQTAAVRARYNVQESGTGSTPLLFAHGFGCDQAMWRFVAPQFEPTHRVIRFDYPGHGDGALDAFAPARHATLHGYADDLLAVCSALDLSDVVVVAHSVSATVALLAAQRAPERFSRLVLIGPSPCYTNEPPDYHGGFERADLEGMVDLMQTNFTAWAGALAPVIAGNPDAPDHARELEASFCRTDHTVACTFAKATFLSDHRADLAGVSTPSLVLQCSDDVIAPEAVGRYVAAQLPSSTFYLMAATGHCPHLTHPTETVAAIRHYLALPPGVPLPMGGR